MDPAQRTPSGRFAPGASGNRAGKPKGCRTRAAATADALGAAATTEVVTKVIEAARRGESWAALAVLKRVWPARAGRPTPVALPPVRTAADVPAAIDAVLAAVGRGELSTSEGADLAGLIDAARRGIETTTLAAEVADLRRQVEEIRK